nr:retrovirus-related Pol polyprotein from transposon TNT 1-94 [Tanacetum cinerariifolium]
MKSLKENVEDRLFKQDQFLQTIHMLCRPKPYYNELNKVDIGYKNPLCLTHAKQVQHALYNGHEIIEDNHAPAIVHNTENTLNIAEITMKKMNDKMKDPKCVTRKVKIAPNDYSKENFLDTFTPQKQLTPERIFWSQDLIKLKSEALKEQTTVSRTIKALIVKKQVTFANPSDTSNGNTHKPVTKVHTQKTNVPMPPSTGVKRCTNASGSQPMSNTKKSRISPAKGVNKLAVEEQSRTNKSLLRTSNRVDSSSHIKRTVVQIIFWYLDSGCSKHMTRDRSRIMNFMKKFIETVRFGNDHFGAIMGYGDYVIGDSVISRIVPRTPQQNDVVERRNRTLVEAARTMLIFSKVSMFLWAEAVATACYTQNRSLIHTLHNKTPYELVHNKKPNLTLFRVFGALYYPTNDSEELGKLQPTADSGIFIGFAPYRKGYRIYNKRTQRIMETIHVQFDELTKPMAPVHLSTGPAPNFLTPGQIKPPRVERSVHPAQAVQTPVNSAGTPSSTTIDQDAPSPSISPSSLALQSYSLHQGVVAESSFMEDNPVAPVDNTPFINIFAPGPYSKASLSRDISSTE